MTEISNLLRIASGKEKLLKQMEFDNLGEPSSEADEEEEEELPMLNANIDNSDSDRNNEDLGDPMAVP
eukprot:11598361-Ditylum_brightwellii.AAC.1